MGTWQTETRRYQGRILRLAESLNCITDEIARLPPAPLPIRLSDKAAIPCPWAGDGETVHPINVMEFVRHADRNHIGAEDDYKFLCDASHPTYLQHKGNLSLIIYSNDAALQPLQMSSGQIQPWSI